MRNLELECEDAEQRYLERQAGRDPGGSRPVTQWKSIAAMGDFKPAGNAASPTMGVERTKSDLAVLRRGGGFIASSGHERPKQGWSRTREAEKESQTHRR